MGGILVSTLMGHCPLAHMPIYILLLGLFGQYNCCLVFSTNTWIGCRGFSFFISTLKMRQVGYKVLIKLSHALMCFLILFGCSQMLSTVFTSSRVGRRALSQPIRQTGAGRQYNAGITDLPGYLFSLHRLQCLQPLQCLLLI